MKLRIENFHFDAAHFLSAHPGKCRRLHGHTYRVDIEVDADAKGYMVMDTFELKKIVREIMEEYDHTLLVASKSDLFLNTNVRIEKKVINGKETTMENIAEQLATEIWQRLPENIRKMKTTLWEGKDASVQTEISKNKGGSSYKRGSK